MSRALPITGLGVICAAGQGSAALAECVVEGRSALSRRSRIPHAIVDPGWTGSVPDRLELALSELPSGEVQRLFVDWAIAAGREALAESRALERFAAGRVGLVLGSNLEDYPLPLWQLASEVAHALRLAGPCVLVSMACASSLAAMRVARTLLENADLDAVVVGGSDVLTPRVAGGFRGLDLLGEQPCAPFSSQVGTALGEGAGVLVIEAIEPGPEGPAVQAWLLGEGTAADAFHETSPEPRGRGTEHALGVALDQAGLGPEHIDLVMTHGTGTQANDAAEARALQRVFGAELARIRVGAGKSLVGHAQGAGGAIELIAALLGQRAGVAPAIANFVAPARPEAPPRLVLDEPSRHAPVHRFIVEGAGFGGAHAAVVVGDRTSTTRSNATTSTPRRPTLRAWTSLLAGEDRRVDRDWRRAVRGVDLRACDPSTRMLTSVVDLALRQARAPRRHATGLFVAQRGNSITALTRLRDELERYGMAGTAASAFTNSLAIMPAGACTRLLELWGPLQLICGDALAAMLALIGAADSFMREPGLGCAVAAGVDEFDRARPEASRDGALALVVGEGGSLSLLGWAVTGRGGDALAQASSRAGRASDRVVRIAALDELGEAIASGASEGGSLALVAEGLGGNAALILAPV